MIIVVSLDSLFKNCVCLMKIVGHVLILVLFQDLAAARADGNS